MLNSKVRKTLQTGLGLAVGLLIANAVFVPLISNRTASAGFFIGVIAGFITLVIYTFIAIAQSRSDMEK
jgi:uncharacterized protein YacL